MIFQDFPDLMSVVQLQKALGIGRSSAYCLLAENRIQHFRIGRTIKIPKSALLEFIAQGGA